jgi:inner membrane protein involved in colicin E2 resistance
MSTQTQVNNHPLFRALLKGVFVGFALAFVFVLLAALFTALGSTFAFLTSTPYMALFGFFIGVGLEVYPALL